MPRSSLGMSELRGGHFTPMHAGLIYGFVLVDETAKLGTAFSCFTGSIAMGVTHPTLETALGY